MMRIQDPPIYMEADYQANSAFDSNKMRSYTKAGKLVHFVVWPTFFLHKDGPLLAKGVVQGSKLEIAGEESTFLSEDDSDDEQEFVDASDNEIKSDGISDDMQANQGNANKLTYDANKSPIDAERLENDGKRENNNSPDDNKSNPEKNELPNDNINASIGIKRSDDVGNGEGDDVPDGKKPDLDKGMQNNTSCVTECSENEEKDVSRNSDEKGAESDKRATDNQSFTNDQEIDS